jgi:hypothetical protein
LDGFPPTLKYGPQQSLGASHTLRLRMVPANNCETRFVLDASESREAVFTSTAA